MNNLQEQFKAVAKASRSLATLSDEKRSQVLLELADYLLEESALVLEANAQDCARMDKDNPMYDRLLLTEQRLQDMANDMRNVAEMSTPVGEILEERILKSGVQLRRKRVPLGVVGMIYEARPNVTFDVFALCFKTGNAVILKGGSDAHESNTALVQLIHNVLEKHSINSDCVFLMPSGREHVKELLEARGLVDVIIPRGSQKLINFVVENAKVPAIETGAGIVHVYVDQSADTEKAMHIVHNSKARRPSVCNALDCLLIHRDKLKDLAEIMSELAQTNVQVFADSESLTALQGHFPTEQIQAASEEHFGTEFLSMRMSIKTVSDLDEALEHIAKYSSKHSESIVAEDEEIIEHYLNAVDAAAVYANAATCFTDGAQFGLGAEIGISTQKLHARGPMALRELTTYKWVLRGNGQIRP